MGRGREVLSEILPGLGLAPAVSLDESLGNRQVFDGSTVPPSFVRGRRPRKASTASTQATQITLFGRSNERAVYPSAIGTSCAIARARRRLRIVVKSFRPMLG